MVAVTTPITKREHHLDSVTIGTPPRLYPWRARSNAMSVYRATRTPRPHDATMPSPASDALLSCDHKVEKRACIYRTKIGGKRIINTPVALRKS